ncbi:MAG: putative photosynthetic complex assembly protein PuhE [Roseiflexaceae bacterium]
MHYYLLPVLYALFIWWFSTGLIIYLDGLPQKTFSASFAFLSLLLFLSLVGAVASRNDVTTNGAYLAFTCGLTIWGWQVASFYMGLITGPRPIACPAGARGWARFWAALDACLYHELASLAGALVLLAISWGAANQYALWGYLVLWLLHLMAKLNVFFGARNLNEEFLPEHMRFLASYFVRKPINGFFPISITIATVVTIVLIQQAAQASWAFDAVGMSFLACMATLGVFELWLLVLPLPMHLWDWSLSSHRGNEIEVPNLPGAERV